MGRPREFSETDALDRALEVFWSNGFESTSMEDLEIALSMGRQSIYNTFGNKHDLFMRALDQYKSRSADTIRRAFEDHRGLTAVRAYFKELVRFVVSAKDRPGCFLARSLMENGDEPAVAKACRSSETELRKRFRRAIDQAIEDGELRQTIPADAAALVLSTHVYGLSLMARASASRKSMLESVDLLIDSLES